MREKDRHDYQAETLFDLVRAGVPDQEVIDAIAEALRLEREVVRTKSE